MHGFSEGRDMSKVSKADAQRARDKVKQARTALVLDQPFFGSLALRLRIVEDTGCPTAWTDGRSLGYNPAFMNALSDAEVLFVIAHEVMHCACGHPWRRDSRSPKRWNFACDYAINPVLIASGFKMPKLGLLDKDFEGKSAEWIYNRLPEMSQDKQKKPGSGESGDPDDDGDPGDDLMPGAGGGDVRDAPSSSTDADENATETEADWQQAVQQAAEAAKMRGKLPAHLERFTKAATAPRVDWRSVLRRFVQQAAKADYSWRRPNTRYLAHGLYLPALHSEAMGPIAVAVDTSGSIDKVTLDQFAAEINAIADDMRPERVSVIYCDAAVGRIDTFEREEPIVLNPVGGGGTDFRPALNAAELLEGPPCCLVYLTDLYGTHRPEPPSMPMLWACTTNQTAPYGEVVSMER